VTVVNEEQVLETTHRLKVRASPCSH